MVYVKKLQNDLEVTIMVNIQPEFIKFHEIIKLSDETKELREKRDILLKKLKEKISTEATSYTHFVQGSYAMGTGIKPTDGDYDIDVGLEFDIDKDEYPDPVTIKKWVKDALDGHTKSVKIRRSCVTVTYQKDSEPVYHVDFACYAANNKDQKLYIAKGKEYSESENRVWELSDPKGLIDLIKHKFSNEDEQAQFKRIIRYMKKWKNEKFEVSGSAAPTGIALTVLAYNLFSPAYKFDSLKGTRVYDDFTALKNFVQSILSRFAKYYDENGVVYYTISQNLPVEPYNDLFSKMTEIQQDDFHSKLSTMKSKLAEVENTDKKSEACKVLAQIFGNDFKISADRSYVGTSESA